jgi:type IV pilus assembly protein PilW
MSLTMKRLSIQRGFSLIELMVAITISLLIFAAVLRLFLDIGRTNDELAKTNEQIENGRFTVQLLQLDLMHAGFWDGYIPNFDNPTASGGAIPDDAPSPCIAHGTAWNVDYVDSLLAVPVQIYAGVPAGCELIITDKRPNTDVIVTRHSDTCVTGSTGCEADISGELYLQVSRCNTDGNRFLLGKTDTDTFNLLQRDCDPGIPANKRRFVSHMYYIKDVGNTPTLMRSTLEKTGTTVAFTDPQALIEGVESLRVELGIDNYNAQTDKDVDYGTGERGDGVPDVYINTAGDCISGCNVENLVNSVSANIYALVRSNQASPGYTDTKTYQLGPFAINAANDNFKRHVFSTNVRFHNISGRREVPPSFAGSGTETDTPVDEPTP